MAETIRRKTITTEEVKVPEGYKPCGACKGKGLMSDYDMGRRTLIHSRNAAALKECIRCHGNGVEKDYEHERWKKQEE